MHRASLESIQNRSSSITEISIASADRMESLRRYSDARALKWEPLSSLALGTEFIFLIAAGFSRKAGKEFSLRALDFDTRNLDVPTQARAQPALTRWLELLLAFVCAICLRGPGLIKKTSRLFLLTWMAATWRSSKISDLHLRLC